MESTQVALLMAAGTLAGVINSIAGGGTLVAFPAALAAGLPPVVASATSSTALTPGALMAAWAYRGELRTKLRAMKYLALPSALGGLVGARFLMSSEERLFGRIVPWMALTATMFIVLRDFLVKRGALGVPPKRARPTRLCAMGLAVFAVAIYGGYFGAGKNIILLAVLTLLQRMSIHEVNAVKSLVVGTLTLVSSTYFIFNGVANLEAVAVLACGSMLGSYLGASTARRVNPTLIRHAVVGIGLTLTTLLGYKQWLSESRATEADHQLTLSH